MAKKTIDDFAEGIRIFKGESYFITNPTAVDIIEEILKTYSRRKPEEGTNKTRRHYSTQEAFEELGISRSALYSHLRLYGDMYGLSVKRDKRKWRLFSEEDIEILRKIQDDINERKMMKKE